jgi:AcrR family transcriptional regulator
MASRTARNPGRREARRQSRRNAIVEVASRSFLESGYAGATMSDIAAQLGGSKATLWSYFPSKEVLFVAVVDQLTEAFRADLSMILASGGEVESALRRFCAEFLRKVTSGDGIALYRLVIRDACRFPEIGRIFHDRGPRLTQQQLADYLADAMRRGRLRAGDPLAAARQLIGLCLSGSHRRLLLGVIDTVAPEEIERDVSEAMDVFLRAYAAG